MGAPTSAHESRVAELETLAALAGFVGLVVLPWRLRPDVVRICPGNGALFLGDAKHTETAGCRATRARLRWYGLIALSLHARRTITVALAVPAGASIADWQEVLVRAVAADTVCASPKTTSLGDTVVITVRTRAADQHDRGPPYRSRRAAP